MSQFNLRNIREISTDPITKFTNILAKRMSQFINDQNKDKLENKEDIYSAAEDIDTVIKFHSLNNTKYFDASVIYYPTYEPNADITLRLWLRGRNTGNTLKDWSDNDRDGEIHGDPVLIDGTPLDMGIYTGGTKSLALKFNRPNSQYENQEYIVIPYDTRHRAIEGLSTGISFFIRFRTFSLSTENGKSRTLYQKLDNATQDGICVKIDTSGKIIVIVRAGSTEYKKETASSTITTNTIYDLVVTYTVSGNVINVYLNNVNKTLNANSDTNNFQADTTNFDWYVFQRGKGTDAGHLYGDFYDFRIYREKILSFNSVGNSALFDGNADSINLGNQASLWSQALTKFSFSFWIYPTGLWDATTRFSMAHGSGAQNFQVHHNASSTGNVTFRIRDSGAANKDASSSAAVANQWNHICCVYDNSLGSANVKVYVNNVVGGTTANLTQSINQSANLVISSTGTDGLVGNMRDFRWWTTKALTTTEIGRVYNNSGLAPTPDYWIQLTEGVNPTDVIGETLTGTATNATYPTSEVTNLYTNKWTIHYIPSGSLPMVSDYFAPY